MASVVSIPPAFAAKLILNGEITQIGVCLPTTKAMYEPILAEMEEFGFSIKKEIVIL